MSVAFSVDLEPNKDGSLDGVADAMRWFDDVVPRGTVFATHAIATELPGLLADLADAHEVGVHVHPDEFDEYDAVQLAELPPGDQVDLIARTRGAIADAVGARDAEVTVFRAGRHSASRETLAALADLGFRVDASVNVTYTDYLPESVTDDPSVRALDGGLVEVPTSFARPRPFTRPWFRTFPGGALTATANTLRTDRHLCSGERALRVVRDANPLTSFYMHPYDASGYHADVGNSGAPFRERFERLAADVSTFVTVGEAAARRRH